MGLQDGVDGEYVIGDWCKSWVKFAEIELHNKGNEGKVQATLYIVCIVFSPSFLMAFCRLIGDEGRQGRLRT